MAKKIRMHFRNDSDKPKAVKAHKIEVIEESCPICNMPGPTKCTGSANCLNIPFDVEQAVIKKGGKFY